METLDKRAFEQIVKEKSALAESIRAKQEEKISLVSEFEKERVRYKSGQISRKALAASIPKVRREMTRLDKAIRRDILSVASVARKATKFARNQSPRAVRITMSGVRSSRASSRSKARRR